MMTPVQAVIPRQVHPATVRPVGVFVIAEILADRYDADAVVFHALEQHQPPVPPVDNAHVTDFGAAGKIADHLAEGVIAAAEEKVAIEDALAQPAVGLLGQRIEFVGVVGL